MSGPPLTLPPTLESEQGAWVVEFVSTGSHGLGSFLGSLSLDALSLDLELSIKAEPSAFRMYCDNTPCVWRQATELRVCSTGILMASALLCEAREQLGGCVSLLGQEGGKEQFPVTCSDLPSSSPPRTLTVTLRVGHLVLIFCS